MPKSETFEDGFIDDWKLIAGARAAVPAIPPQPIIAAGKTSYAIGVLLGTEAAKRRKGIQ
jgi:hypothetical protein